MWGRPAKSRAPAPVSLIGPAITIAGDVRGEAELHLEGRITGDVDVSRLCIGEGGRIDGAVTAEAVEVRGEVAGSIKAREIRLFATARVEGDLTHDSLTIDTGARFEGRSLTAERPRPVLLTAT